MTYISQSPSQTIRKARMPSCNSTVLETLVEHDTQHVSLLTAPNTRSSTLRRLGEEPGMNWGEGKTENRHSGRRKPTRGQRKNKRGLKPEVTSFGTAFQLMTDFGGESNFK